MLIMIMTAAIMLPFTATDVFAGSSNTYTYHLPYWHGSGTYTGGWERHEGDAMYFFEINEVPGQIAYCLEPGRARVNGTVANTQSPDDIFRDGNGVIDGPTIKRYVELILNYGYKGSPASLNTAGGSTDPSDNLYYAVATQILLWEVIIGERDANFNFRNAGNENLSTFILGSGTEADAPDVLDFHRKEDVWYKMIESSVKEYISKPVRPSFSFESKEKAASSRYDVDTASRTVVLNDANGLIGDFTEIVFTCGDNTVNVDFVVDRANNRITVAFNDRSVNINDVVMTLRSRTPSRRYIIAYGDGKWGPGWAEQDNWQEIATWGDAIYERGYVRFTDKADVSLKKIADSDGDSVAGLLFGIWRYGPGRSSGAFDKSKGDTLLTYARTNGSGDLIWDLSGSTVLTLAPGKYGLEEYLTKQVFKTLDDKGIPYSFAMPSGTGSTWYTDGNEKVYTVIDLTTDRSFQLHNIRQQGSFEMVKKLVNESDEFKKDDIEFVLYYDADSDKTISSADALVARGKCDTSGNVLWNGNGFTGRKTISALPAGDYIVRESWTGDNVKVANTSSGWIKRNDKTYELPFRITHNAGSSFTVTNEAAVSDLYKTDITVFKVDEDDVKHYLKGAQFKIYSDVNGNGKYDKGTDKEAKTYKNGSYKNVNIVETADGKGTPCYRTDGRLKEGKYVIVETKTPEGFSLIDGKDTYAVSVPSSRSGEIENISVVAKNRCRGRAEIYKYDEWYGTALEGAEFTIYEDDEGHPGDEIGKMTYDDEKKIYYADGLSYGSYIIRETESPDGYIKNDDLYPFTIEEDGQVAVISDLEQEGIMNSPYAARIMIYKVDSNNSLNFLTGAEFEIYEDTNGNGEFDSDDEIAKSFCEGELKGVKIEEGTDDTNTPVYLSDLPLRFGNYYLVETKAPEGFRLDDDNVYPVTVGRSEEEEGVPVYGNKSMLISNGLEGSISITKIDKDYPGNRLSGAVFSVYSDTNGNGTLEKDEDESKGIMTETSPGEYMIGGLPSGRYFITEDESPEGFIKRDDIWEAVIDRDGMVYKIEDAGFEGLYNEKIPEEEITPSPTPAPESTPTPEITPAPEVTPSPTATPSPSPSVSATPTPGVSVPVTGESVKRSHLYMIVGLTSIVIGLSVFLVRKKGS